MGIPCPSHCRCGNPLTAPPDGRRFRCPGCKAVYDLDWRTGGTSEVAVPGRWKIEPSPAPFQELQVGWTFNDADYERLTWGFVPRAMEDKWFILFEDSRLLFVRSWSGALIYVAHLSGKAIVRIEVSSEVKGDLTRAEMVRWLIDRFLLGVEAPIPG